MDLTTLTKEQLIEKLSVHEDRYSKMKNKATKYLQDNQNIRLFNSCKLNAKKGKISFSLTVEDIVIPSTCIYLGIELTNVSGNGRVFSNASVDRKNPDMGYTKDNIQIISDLANRMKQNATEEQLIAFAKGVLKIHDRIKHNKQPS